MAARNPSRAARVAPISVTAMSGSMETAAVLVARVFRVQLREETRARATLFGIAAIYNRKHKAAALRSLTSTNPSKPLQPTSFHVTSHGTPAYIDPGAAWGAEPASGVVSRYLTS
jgi:hypothetical protein